MNKNNMVRLIEIMRKEHCWEDSNGGLDWFELKENTIILIEGKPWLNR